MSGEHRNQRVDACPLLKEGGGEGNDELRAVGWLKDGAPGVLDMRCLLTGRPDVAELLINVFYAPNILQHLPALLLLHSQ